MALEDEIQQSVLGSVRNDRATQYNTNPQAETEDAMMLRELKDHAKRLDKTLCQLQDKANLISKSTYEAQCAYDAVTAGIKQLEATRAPSTAPAMGATGSRYS